LSFAILNIHVGQVPHLPCGHPLPSRERKMRFLLSMGEGAPKARMEALVFVGQPQRFVQTQRPGWIAGPRSKCAALRIRVRLEAAFGRYRARLDQVQRGVSHPVQQPGEPPRRKSPRHTDHTAPACETLGHSTDDRANVPTACARPPSDDGEVLVQSWSADRSQRRFPTYFRHVTYPRFERGHSISFSHGEKVAEGRMRGLIHGRTVRGRRGEGAARFL
jgi:hypothetical protein